MPDPLRRQRQARQHRSRSIAQPDVDGALVGGASLDVRTFAEIARQTQSADGFRLSIVSHPGLQTAEEARDSLRPSRTGPERARSGILSFSHACCITCSYRVYVLVCLLLIVVILLQQGKGGDIANAFGGGGSQAAFGARAGATVLTKATAGLAAAFIVLSLTLAVWGQRGRQFGRRRHRGPGGGDTGAGGTARPRTATTPAPARGAARDTPRRRRRTRRRNRGREPTPDLPRHPHLLCGSGGIGRRTSLRGWRSQERGGSSPPFRTTFRINRLTDIWPVLSGHADRDACLPLCE